MRISDWSSDVCSSDLSTGGITNKQVGRVGDAPIIGAGCYASNRRCAVSTTGTGEMFIRAVAAYDVAARMEYGGASLQAAADRVVFATLPAIQRSEEHTSELQSLKRISYAVSCLNKNMTSQTP